MREFFRLPEKVVKTSALRKIGLKKYKGKKNTQIFEVIVKKYKCAFLSRNALVQFEKRFMTLFEGEFNFPLWPFCCVFSSKYVCLKGDVACPQIQGVPAVQWLFAKLRGF